jgi:hypothetical protein
MTKLEVSPDPSVVRNRIDKALFEADHGECIDGELFIRGLLDDLNARETKREVLRSLPTPQS